MLSSTHSFRKASSNIADLRELIDDTKRRINGVREDWSEGRDVPIDDAILATCEVIVAAIESVVITTPQYGVMDTSKGYVSSSPHGEIMMNDLVNIIVDPTIPADTIVAKNPDGTTAGIITNIGSEKEGDDHE